MKERKLFASQIQSICCSQGSEGWSREEAVAPVSCRLNQTQKGSKIQTKTKTSDSLSNKLFYYDHILFPCTFLLMFFTWRRSGRCFTGLVEALTRLHKILSTLLFFFFSPPLFKIILLWVYFTLVLLLEYWIIPADFVGDVSLIGCVTGNYLKWQAPIRADTYWNLKTSTETLQIFAGKWKNVLQFTVS